MSFTQRLSAHRVLENENRRRILDTVEARPNVNLTGLVAATSLAKSLVRYHVHVLEHAGALRSHRAYGARCYVTMATVARLGRAATRGDAVLRAYDPVAATVRDASCAMPQRLEAVVRAVMPAAGVSRIGAWKGVRRAARQGLVHLARRGPRLYVVRAEEVVA